MVLTWAKIGIYIDAGGLEHVDIHKEPVAPREKGGRAVKRAPKNEDSAQLPCFGWASRGDAGSSEREIRASTATNRPTNTGNRKKSDGGAGWAAHKKPKAGVRTTPSASASGDGGGSGKGGSSAKSSKGDDEQGCGLRQLAEPTLVTERARVSADDAQLVRPRLASFSQPGAEVGASGCRSLYRSFGHQYLRRSVARSSERTQASGFRSWCTFRGLTAQDRYLRPCESEEAKVWALIDFAAWCWALQDNQAGSTSSKLAAIQYIHRVDVGIELSIRSPLIKHVLQGISRSHTLAGTRPRVRLPISWDVLIEGQELLSS